MVQSLAMCLRPATPRSLTEPVSFGYIDPSRRVSRAELDRMDKLWREKQPKLIVATRNTADNTNARASFESDMTRVEGRQNYNQQQPASNSSSPPLYVPRTTNVNGTIRKNWLFTRRQPTQPA
jgi:hypothetical protein